MYNLIHIYPNMICSRIEVENFARRLKPLKICEVHDYPGILCLVWQMCFFSGSSIHAARHAHFGVGDPSTGIIKRYGNCLL